MSEQAGLLTSVGVREYWDGRHARVGDLRSGGNLAYDEATNGILYAVRLGRLLELMGFGAAPEAPLDVLDAGCGKGYFARGVAACGHRVDAIDASLSALEGAARRGSGPHWAQSTLADWRPTHLYDVVYCIDVLFHVVEREEWSRSVCNLADLVRVGGTLILTDVDVPSERVFGNYQVARPLRAYAEAVAPRGLVHVGSTPDGFRATDMMFHVFGRRG